MSIYSNTVRPTVLARPVVALKHQCSPVGVFSSRHSNMPFCAFSTLPMSGQYSSSVCRCARLATEPIPGGTARRCVSIEAISAFRTHKFLFATLISGISHFFNGRYRVIVTQFLSAPMVCYSSLFVRLRRCVFSFHPKTITSGFGCFTDSLLFCVRIFAMRIDTFWHRNIIGQMVVEVNRR